MPLKITIGEPATVVKVISSGPGWLTLLVTFLLGAALTFAVQLYVVPRVETRKRREDRWERKVLELGELLTMSVTNQANELHAAQLVYREVRDQKGDEHDPALVARQARDAEQESFAYGSLVGTQVDWLIDRVISLSPKAQEIKRLDALWLKYRIQTVLVRRLPEDDNFTDTQFDEAWEKERDARKALINQVKLLADLPHPPRAPWLDTARPAGGSDLLGGPDPV